MPPRRVSWLTPEQVASRLHVSVQTLAQYRHIGRGPRYVKEGGRVRYDPDGVTAWLEQHRTARPSAAASRLMREYDAAQTRVERRLAHARAAREERIKVAEVTPEEAEVAAAAIAVATADERSGFALVSDDLGAALDRLRRAVRAWKATQATEAAG
jgi:hypothetical protein